MLSLASRDETDCDESSSKQNVAMAADLDQISLNASDMSATGTLFTGSYGTILALKACFTL